MYEKTIWSTIQKVIIAVASTIAEIIGDQEITL
ncbi:MAG: smalltalk protein [Bacteroides nordii]